MTYLKTLFLILLFSWIARQLSLKARVPTVVGQLIAGIILGPAVLHWVRPDSFVNYLSELGVIFLMFLAGLKSNLPLLKRYLKPSLVVASIGVAFPMVVMPTLGRFIAMTWAQALFLGVTFAATSVSISVAVLDEMHQLKTREGTTILGAAVADDIIAVVLLSIISSISGQNVGSVSFSVWVAVLLQIIYFVFLVMLIRMADRFRKAFSNVTGAILLCLGLSYLASLVGLSSITGAFFAGLIISQLKGKSNVIRKTSPLSNLVLVPVFFISIGLSMTLPGVVEHWFLLLVLTVLAILTKFCGAGLGALLCHFNWKSSGIIGAGMISRGEVALIIAQLGYAHHLLSVTWYSTIISAIILTTIAAPILLKLFVKNGRRGKID